METSPLPIKRCKIELALWAGRDHYRTYYTYVTGHHRHGTSFLRRRDASLDRLLGIMRILPLHRLGVQPIYINGRKSSARDIFDHRFLGNIQDLKHYNLSMHTVLLSVLLQFSRFISMWTQILQFIAYRYIFAHHSSPRHKQNDRSVIMTSVEATSKIYTSQTNDRIVIMTSFEAKILRHKFWWHLFLPCSHYIFFTH